MHTDRRERPRASCVLPVRLMPLGERTIIETLTKNVSTGGVKCISSIERPVGTRMSVELDLGDRREPVRARGLVSWFGMVPDSDQFFIGITFTELEPDDRRHLSGYLDKLLHASV